MRPRLDSRALALFLAVAEARSFRQAAEILHLSQPPLSRAIRELEGRLGVELFVRGSQGVTLTDAGERLLPYARRVAALLSEAERALAPAATPRAVRLGMTPSVQPAWFAAIPERLARLPSPVALEVVHETSPRLVRLLRHGRLDAALVALPTELAGLRVEVVDRIPMMVAMHAGHRLAKRRIVRLADIAADPLFWFARARQPAFFDHCRKVFARHGYRPATIPEPQDHHVLLGELAKGRAVALLPASFKAIKAKGVVYRALAEGEELGVGIGLATAGKDTDIGRLLREHLRP